MNQFTTLKVSQQGEILSVFLNRPEVANCINMQMVRELSDLIDRVDDSPDVVALIIRGNDKVFSKGIDLHDFASDQPPDIHGLHKWEKMIAHLESLDKLTVAAVQGECFGGGVQLVLACDMRVAEKNAIFALNEVKMGFLPGMATFRLAKYIGLGRAKNLILTGRPVGAEEALELGILDRVCDFPSFETALEETLKGLLPLHPIPLGLARRLLNESYSNSYEDFLGHFLAAQHRAINSEVFKELVMEASQGVANSEGKKAL